jgi:hypothetical protein
MLLDYFFGRDGVWDWMNKHNAEDIAATMKAEKPWIEETREFFGLGNSYSCFSNRLSLCKKKTYKIKFKLSLSHFPL